MLGGVSSFSQGGHARTPIGEMLPVYLSPDDTRTVGNLLSLRLTRAGLLESWTRLRATESDERKRLERVPGFVTLNAVGEVKPGAVAVAEVLDGEATRPAIVTQRFGAGRTMAILLGDLWRWSLQRETHEDRDPAIFWRQTIRQLVADVPRRTELQVEPGAAGQATLLRLRVRNAEFLPDDDASAELSLQTPDGKTITLPAEASSAGAGLYEAEYWPSSPGGYVVSARVLAGDGQPLPVTDAGWVYAPHEQEFERLEVNTDVLTQLSSVRGGGAVDPAAIAQFVAGLRRRPVPITEPWIAPLWHQAGVFLLAVACLCAEWGLRRGKGLA
jgi:hypothetical protein